MDKNPIFSLIKTECGRAKYEMLASKKGIFNRIDFIGLSYLQRLKIGI